MEKESFLTYLSDNAKSPTTIKTYNTILSHYYDWIEKSGTTVVQAKAITIHEYLNHMRNIEKKSQATINKHLACLKSFYKYLYEEGKIKDIPTKRVELEKINPLEKTESLWLTPYEQEQFIAYVKINNNDFLRIRDLAIIDLMLRAGLRVSEVTTIQRSFVQKTAMNDYLVGFIGKGGRYETVTLVKEHAKNFKDWLEIREELTKPYHIESPYLFVSQRSGQLKRDGINTMLEKYAKLAKMNNINPHRFRHSFCKNLARAGHPPEVIRRLARHRRIETTMIYIDASYEEQIEALRSTKK